MGRGHHYPAQLLDARRKGDHTPTEEVTPDAQDHAATIEAIFGLLAETDGLPASDLTGLVDAAARALGATSARVLLADYSLMYLQVLGEGPTGHREPVEGTLAGRCFARTEVVVTNDDPSTVFIPLLEDSDRLGVLELTHPAWSAEVQERSVVVTRLLALMIVSRRRYTDVALRSRRVQTLSLAAEMQWDLLPPLTASTASVSVSGILEPAYSIGGDSFDFAVNPDRLEFAIIDAVGHGMASVLMSVATVTCLRNARRESAGLDAAYHDAGATLETQFGRSNFVTGILGELDLETGLLTWVNAGHPLPMLVRDGSYVGELSCRPSMPLGLGGSIAEIATQTLQRGDRVLFFTDGVSEARGVDGDEFGLARLADFLVRATLDHVSPAETVRRLSSSIMAYNGYEPRDDASLLLVEYHGPDRSS